MKAGRIARESLNKTKAAWFVPVWSFAGSEDRERTPKREGRSESSEKSKASKKRQGKSARDKKEVTKDAPKALIHGKMVTLKQYIHKRRFNFLHLYAGAEDPLGSAIRRIAKERKMKVTVTSCDKEEGVDLLAQEPYESYLKQAHEGFWDGVHSGFPCTSFSKLRWRKAEGYPGPVRSKQHPYGLPDLPRHRREEADEGTLHVSRAVHLEEAILNSRPGDTFKPVATVENPPPSEHPQHLSAWELPELAGLFDRHGFTLAEFTTCRYQSRIPLGQRNYKPQMFGGTLPGLSSLRGVCMCGEGVGHDPIIGKEKSAASARYPDELCNAYAILLLGQFERMAKAEFYDIRAKDLAKEVSELRAKSTAPVTRPRSPSARRQPKSKRRRLDQDNEDLVRATATSKAKAEPKSESEAKPEPVAKAKTKAKEEEEYEYTYETYSEDAEQDELEKKKEAKAEPPKSEKSLEWKGGRGKFGLLKEQSDKASDPAKLNYVGGMRNPTEAVSGMPAAQNLGLRIFAAWERFTRSNALAMEAAADYGTKECKLNAKVVEQWRAELRKLVGSKGKMKVNLKSRWAYQSPIQGDIVEAWTSRASDVDVDIARWVAEGTPLGINEQIPMRGVFPPADAEAEAESMADAAYQLERGTLTNYSSVQENLEDTKVEVSRLEELGFLVKVDRREVERSFSQGTISRLAIIVKERPDKTKKRRLIIDLRRSGGNSKARLREKLVLPRACDAIHMIKQMVKLKQEPSAQEMKDLWKRELVLVDVSDAFPHLAVHARELEHCLTPGLRDNEFYLFRALLFGYKTAPLLWSRTAAWLARFLQSSVPLHEGQHQVYLDDSLWILQGTLIRRNVVLGFIVFTMAALGFSVSVQKGERGASVTWMGIEFRLISNNELLITLPEKFLSDVQQRLEAWETKGMAATKELRTICGKVAWLSGTKWMLRVFYAVLTHREAEVRQGVEESRRTKRDDPRPKEHLFPVKRLEGARAALLEYLKVTKERPTRKISLSPHDRARVCINTDASPEGLGAVLIINGQVIDVLASPVSERDAKDLDFELGSSASQGVVEGLALLVALRFWGPKLAGMSVDLTVQADSVTALAMIQKRSAASPTLNFLGAVMGIWMEQYRVEDIRLLHIPGVANKAQNGANIFPVGGVHPMAGSGGPADTPAGLGMDTMAVLQASPNLPFHSMHPIRGRPSLGMAPGTPSSSLAGLIQRPAAAPDTARVGGLGERRAERGGRAQQHEGELQRDSQPQEQPIMKKPKKVGELLNHGKEPNLGSFGALNRESFFYSQGEEDEETYPIHWGDRNSHLLEFDARSEFPPRPPPFGEKPIDKERERPNALNSVLRIASRATSKAKEKLSMVATLWSPKKTSTEDPPVPPPSRLPETSTSARRSNNHLGKRRKAVNILAIARRARRSKDDVDKLEAGFASNSSRSSRKAVRNTVQSVFKEARGGSMFPPSVEKLKLLGGVLKAAHYKSAPNYLGEYKLMSIEAGHPWSDQLERTLKLCKRSTARAAGPKTKAAEVPTCETGEYFALRVNPDCPKKVALAAELFDFGVIWMLREIELALVAKDHIKLDFNSKRVTFTLPVSKTDQECQEVKRVLQCMCTGKICDVSCPFFVAVRLLDKMIALGRRTASVLDNGKPASKAQLVRDWKSLFGEQTSGHSARRTGALRYIRSGWSISQVAYLGRWRSSIILEYAAEALESLPVNMGQAFKTEGSGGPASQNQGDSGQQGLIRMEEIKVYLLAELEAAKSDNAKSLRALDDEVEALKLRDASCNNSLPVGVQAVASKITHHNMELASCSPPHLWRTLCGWYYHRSDFVFVTKIAVGTAGPHLPAPDRSGHCRTSSASSRSQWALPDLICQLQIAVGTAGPQLRVPDRSGHCRTSAASARSQWALPDFSCDCQSAVGTAGLQPRAPDRSGHCRTSAASSRSQWALPDFSRELQIAVGTAGLQPRLPDGSGHCRTSAASSRSQWALPDFSRELQIPMGIARKNDLIRVDSIQHGKNQKVPYISRDHFSIKASKDGNFSVVPLSQNPMWHSRGGRLQLLQPGHLPVRLQHADVLVLYTGADDATHPDGPGSHGSLQWIFKITVAP
eukprot:s2919_g2.t1